MKKCCTCKQMLDERHFNKNSSLRDGLSTCCRSCHSQYQRDTNELKRKAKDEVNKSAHRFAWLGLDYADEML